MSTLSALLLTEVKIYGVTRDETDRAVSVVYTLTVYSGVGRGLGDTNHLFHGAHVLS